MTFASISICYFMLCGYGCSAFFMCVLSYPSGFFTPLALQNPFSTIYLFLETYSYEGTQFMSHIPHILYTLISGWSSVSANRANGGDALTN